MLSYTLNQYPNEINAKPCDVIGLGGNPNLSSEFVGSHPYRVEDEILLNRRQQLNRIEEDPILYLKWEDMNNFVDWRMSNDNETFPYTTGAQNVDISFFEVEMTRRQRQFIVAYTTEQETNIIKIPDEAFFNMVDIDNQKKTEDLISSMRGVDGVSSHLVLRQRGGLDMLNIRAQGTVKYFYEEALINIIQTVERIQGENINFNGLSVTEKLEVFLNIPIEILAAAVGEVYILVHEDMIPFTQRLLNLIRLIYEAYLMVPGMKHLFRNANGEVDEMLIIESLTYLYTRRSKAREFQTTQNIISVEEFDNRLYDLAFIARYKLLEGDLEEQYKILTQSLNTKDTLEEFNEKLRNPNTRIVTVVTNNYYKSEKGTRIIYVENKEEVFTILLAYQPEEFNNNDLAIGKFTRYIYLPGREMNFYGDNTIILPREIREKYPDNSNSGRMCGITSLIFNEVILGILHKLNKRPEDLIAEIAITAGLYVKNNLIPISGEVLGRIRKILTKWLAKRMICEGVIITEGSIRRTDKGKKTLRSTEIFYKIKRLDGRVEISRQSSITKKDRETLSAPIEIYVIRHEGHIFNCFNERHYVVLSNYLKKEDNLQLRCSKIQSIINTSFIELYVSSIEKEKYKLLEFEELWVTGKNQRVKFLPSEIIQNKDEEEISKLTGGGVSKSLISRMYHQSVKITRYYYYDLETCMINGTSKIHTYVLKNEYEESKIGSWLGQEYDENNEVNLMYEMLLTIASDVYANRDEVLSDSLAIRNVTTSRLMGIYFKNVRVFAHNGGRFDNVLIRNLMCKCREHTNNLNMKLSLVTDIIAGGNMKLLGVEVKLPPPKEYKGDEEELKFNIVFVDSINLLGCPLKDIAKNYGLDVTQYAKGDIPHRFFEWLVNNHPTKMRWTVDELKALELRPDISEDLKEYIEGKEGEINFQTECVTYCMQDVEVMKRGLIKAEELFHSIPTPSGILQDKGMIIWSENQDGKVTTSTLRFRDCVTISGFAKKLFKAEVLFNNVENYSTCADSYVRVATGGVTYCKQVTEFISSQIKDIVKNKYFYIDSKGNAPLIRELEKYGYDKNKPKETYDVNNPPEEILQLQENLKNQNNSCIALVDANSLYPAAIARISFPQGNHKVIPNDNMINELLSQDKRFIAYFRVKWTRKGILQYNVKKAQKLPLMHQIVIKTKTGNRHLRPTDQENKCVGMTDIMLRSIIETDMGYFDLEFINGIYWENSSNDFGDLIKVLYNKRVELKKQGLKVEELIKLIMNSSYGFLLEKCHTSNSHYVGKLPQIIEKKSEIINPAKGILETINNKVFIESQYAAMKRQKGPLIESESEMDNMMRVEVLNHKKIWEYGSLGAYGSFVLDSSKYLMNKLGFYILYTDTDSAFIKNQDYNKLKANEHDLMNESTLGMFKSDFNDKFKEAKPFIDIGIVSILSVFLAKKLYCNVLLGVMTSPEGQGYISCKVKQAGKGIVKDALTIGDYRMMSNDNISVKQYRVVALEDTTEKPVFKIIGGVKNGRGIKVINKHDPDRETSGMVRSIRNQNNY